MAFDWCVMLIPELQGQEKGAVLRAALWPKGSVISFAFLDGNEDLQRRVASVAQEWISKTGADLVLQRQDSVADADVRISFRLKGSWSHLGRYAKSVESDKPTMNYGWLTPNSSDEEVREVVLHEFGHALGFIHEHQNPDGGIEWNRNAVIASLSGPPNEWDLHRIESNVLGGYDPRALIGTPFDEKSIMLYPFPASWTTNGVGTTNNSDLSDMDIELAKRIYAP